MRETYTRFEITAYTASGAKTAAFVYGDKILPGNGHDGDSAHDALDDLFNRLDVLLIEEDGSE